MSRPDISPLISAKAALHASESAERAGDMDKALAHALNAITFAEMWRDALYAVAPEKCTHGVALDVDCVDCTELAKIEAHKADCAKWNGYIAEHKE